MASKIIVLLLIIMMIVGIIFTISFVPSSAVSGGPQVTVCTLSLTATGTYNDNGFSRTISNFQVAYASTGCHVQTLLDLLPTSSNALNLFGFTFNLGVTLTDSQGTNHCSCTIGVNVPALQYGFGFSGSTAVSNVPVGTYTLLVTSPFTFSSGSTTYSEHVIVSPN